MKKSFLILLFAILAGARVFCQVNFTNYSSLSLPENIKKDADAVYRLDEGILDITSSSKYVYKTHQVITLLNQDAAHHLRQTFLYNKFKKVENILFKIYNANGDLLRNYQKKDFQTKDYTDDITMYADDKLLYLQAPSPGYPCTVEIVCEQKTNSYVELPDWIIASPGEAVEYSSYIVKMAPQLAIKYKARNIDLKPQIETTGVAKIYSWTVKNIPAIKPEADSYASYNLPKIDIAPEAFEYDGYKGEFKSWQTVGAWFYQFFEDTKPFNKADVQKIQALVTDCKTDREKIKTLYTNLEQTMRYVSIQLGIGGFKPFAVKYVADKKYGDCKALTNYMRYVLKAVGINAYPALVNAGYNKPPADIDFPCDPFNHVVLCVPLNKDSVWLECTSNNNEYGFLGSFTEDKNALLLTENGGVLVATPKSNYANSVLCTKTIIKLDEDGGSQVTTDIFCSGDFWNLFYQVMNRDDNIKKNIFINYLHYKIPEQFKINAAPDVANGKEFNLALSYDQQFDFKAGNKLFFKPRLASLSSENIQPVATRKYDCVFDFPYIKIDTTVYMLPARITIDKLPGKKELFNEYASYSNEYIKNSDGNTITIIGNLTLKKRVVKPGDYLQVANFFQDVKRFENEKFIVKKN